MKKRFFGGLLTILVVFISWNTCYANLLSVLPEPATGGVSSYYTISARFTDASKLFEDLYPSKLLEAVEPLSSNLGLDSLVSIGNVMKALSKSNLREFACLFIINDENSKLLDGGMIMSVPGGEKILSNAAESGKLTFFNLVLSLGEPVLDAIKAVDDSVVDFEFERGSDGIFFLDDNYVYIEGDKIIFFETRESVLSVAKAIKSDKSKVTNLKIESQNVILIDISKKAAKMPEDLNIQFGITYDDSTWKIKGVSNIFKLTSKSINSLKGENLEKALEVIETIPMVGKGVPFFTSGGKTFIDDGLNTIEEHLMNTGDMDLTLYWATFLQIVQQYGISRKDLGNLLSESTTIVFGLETKFFGIPLPLGGYIAFTGKEKAAENIIGTIYENLAQSDIATESKADGWDRVYIAAIDPKMPNALIAQSGETLLFGIMNPEDLITKLDFNKIGFPSEKMLSWLVLSTEKIWKAVRNAFTPVSAIAMSGMFGKISDSEKEAVQFAQHLFNTDFPMNAFSLWVTSAEEFEIDILMNPSPEGNFWKVFFEWLVKFMD